MGLARAEPLKNWMREHMKLFLAIATIFALNLAMPALAIAPVGQEQIVNQETECPEGQTWDDEQEKCVPAE